MIGGGIDTFWLPELPGRVQVMLAVRLLAMADELDPDEKYAFKNQIRDPHGDVIGDVGGELGVMGQAARPEWLTGITFPLAVVFDVTEEGTYTLEFSVADAVPESLPIHVVHGLPPGTPQPTSDE